MQGLLSELNLRQHDLDKQFGNYCGATDERLLDLRAQLGDVKRHLDVAEKQLWATLEDFATAGDDDPSDSAVLNVRTSELASQTAIWNALMEPLEIAKLNEDATSISGPAAGRYFEGLFAGLSAVFNATRTLDA